MAKVAILSTLLLVLFLPCIFAQAPDTTEGGTITVLNISSFNISYQSAWRGYYGELLVLGPPGTGWTLLSNITPEYNVTGRNLSTLCTDVSGYLLITNRSNAPDISSLAPGSLDALDAVTGPVPDSGNRTFTVNTTFVVGGQTIDDVPTAYPYVNGGEQAAVFREGLLTDGDTFIFVAELDRGAVGFDGRPHDFQFLLPYAEGEEYFVYAMFTCRWCGDGICNDGEDCRDCPEDCGKCKVEEKGKVEGFIFPGEPGPPGELEPVEGEPIVNIEIEPDKPVFDLSEQLTGIVTVEYIGGLNIDAILTVYVEGYEDMTLEFPLTLLAPESVFEIPFAFDIPAVAEYDIVAVLEGVEGIRGKTRAQADVRTRAPEKEPAAEEPLPLPIREKIRCMVFSIDCIIVIIALLLIAGGLLIVLLWAHRKGKVDLERSKFLSLLTDGGDDINEYKRMYSEELGIDLASGKESELFKWLVASILFGGRISQGIAAKTYMELKKAKLLTPKELVGAGQGKIIKALDEGGYARYDESTARRLTEVTRAIGERYGSLKKLHETAEGSADLEEKLTAFNGIGPVTANIFLRELRVVWEKADPEPSKRAKKEARFLKINIDHLNRKTERFMRLEAALIRLSKVRKKR